MYAGNSIRLPQGAEPAQPRCQEERNEDRHWKDFSIPLTLGNRETKWLATEGWNTYYGIIIAFNGAPLQVLKRFSILVPFCAHLENNLQKGAVLARIILKKSTEFLFIFLPSLPFPSVLLPNTPAVQYVTGNELQGNAILTCFLLRI